MSIPEFSINNPLKTVIDISLTWAIYKFSPPPVSSPHPYFEPMYKDMALFRLQMGQADSKKLKVVTSLLASQWILNLAFMPAETMSDFTNKQKWTQVLQNYYKNQIFNFSKAFSEQVFAVADKTASVASVILFSCEMLQTDFVWLYAKSLLETRKATIDVSSITEKNFKISNKNNSQIISETIQAQKRLISRYLSTLLHTSYTLKKPLVETTIDDVALVKEQDSRLRRTQLRLEKKEKKKQEQAALEEFILRNSTPSPRFTDSPSSDSRSLTATPGYSTIEEDLQEDLNARITAIFLKAPTPRKFRCLQRITRWHKPELTLADVLGFKDYDDTGALIHKYTGLREEDLKKQIAFHHIPAEPLIFILEHPDFEGIYFGKEDYKPTHPGFIFQATYEINKESYQGLIHLGISASNIVYHLQFVPLDEKSLKIPTVSSPPQETEEEPEEPFISVGPQRPMRDANNRLEIRTSSGKVWIYPWNFK